jgi:hypothetical protein
MVQYTDLGRALRGAEKRQSIQVRDGTMCIFKFFRGSMVASSVALAVGCGSEGSPAEPGDSAPAVLEQPLDVPGLPANAVTTIADALKDGSSGVMVWRDGTGYSYKDEGDNQNPLRKPAERAKSLPGTSIVYTRGDGVYRDSWGCNRALKVSNFCLAVVNGSDIRCECLVPSVGPVAGACTFVQAGDIGWQNCPK